MNQQPLPKGSPFSFKYFLLGLILLCAGMVFPLGYLVVPAFLAWACFKSSPSLLFPLGLLGLAAALVLYGGQTGIFMFLLAFLPAVLICLLYRKKVSPFYTFAAVGGTGILLLYLALCLPGLLSGAGAFGPIVEKMDSIFAASRELLLTMPEGYGNMNQEEFLAFFDRYTYALTDSIATLVVPTICQLALGMALSNVLLFQRFSRALPEVDPLPPFRAWQVPRDLTGGMCFMLVASLALDLFDLEYATAVSSTVSVIVGFPLIVQGLSLIDHLIHTRSKNKKRTRIIAYIAIGLLYYVLRTSLMLLGAMEQLFHLRERKIEPPPQMPKF